MHAGLSGHKAMRFVRGALAANARAAKGTAKQLPSRVSDLVVRVLLLNRYPA